MAKNIREILHDANLALSFLRENLPDQSSEVTESLSMAQSAMGRLVNLDLDNNDKTTDEVTQALTNILESLHRVNGVIENLSSRVSEVEEQVKSSTKIKAYLKKPKSSKINPSDIKPTGLDIVPTINGNK